MFDFLKSENKVPFPIVEEFSGGVVLPSNKTVFCFEVTPPDMEQLLNIEIEFIYSALKAGINNLSSRDWIKVHRLKNGKIYLSSNTEDLEFLGFNLAPLESSVEAFFGTDLIYSDVDFYESHLTVNGEYWALVNVDAPPTVSRASFLDDYNTDYFVSFHKVSDEIATRQLEMRRKSQGVTNDTIHRNHKGLSAYYQTDQMLEDIEIGGEGLFRAQVWFIVKSDNRRELQDKTRHLIRRLESAKAKAFIETSGLDYFFNHSLIGVPSSSHKEFTCNSDYLCNLIPNHQERLHEKGIPLRSREGNVLNFDFFHESYPNYNTLITGMSGLGKSVFFAVLAYYLHEEEDVNLAIFDMGGSFTRLCRYLGGIELQNNFNPLQFMEADFLYGFILSVVGKDEFDKQTKGLLYSKLKEIIENELVFEDFQQLLELLNQTIPNIIYYFSEVLDYLSADFIEAPSVFYLNTSGIPDDLIAPYMLFAQRLSEDQKGRTIRAFDECWDYLEKCPMILQKSVKAGRKEGIASVFLTQEIDDFTSKYGSAAVSIIGNTFNKLFLYQPSLEHNSIKEHDKPFLESLKKNKGGYSELLILNGEERKFVQLHIDKFFFELTNTEQNRREAQTQYIDDRLKFMSYREAFHSWVDHV